MSVMVFTLGLLALVSLVVICGTVILVAALLRKERSSERRSSDASETQLIQGLNQNINRLEQRIESIETILMNSDPNKERKS